MRKNPLGIATGGERRLRTAIQAEVRQEYQEALSRATDYWQQVAIEAEIRKEVKKRMKRAASPYSLWSSHCKQP